MDLKYQSETAWPTALHSIYENLFQNNEMILNTYELTYIFISYRFHDNENCFGRIGNNTCTMFIWIVSKVFAFSFLNDYVAYCTGIEMICN